MNHSRKGLLLALWLLPVLAAFAPAQELPTWLPRYDLDVRLDVDQRTVTTRQQVTWTNRHQRPANTLVFNAHATYAPLKKDIGFFAKTLEILRVSPKDAMDVEGHALKIQKAFVLDEKGKGEETEFHLSGDTETDLVIRLPRLVGPGESVTILLEHVVHLPAKLGRWGQWQGVTYLSNWLPILAVYDEAGWHPVPYIPWHQPFFNEAGIFHAKVALPECQKLACTGSVTGERKLDKGFREVHISAPGVRDFALLCSARYEEFIGQVEGDRGLSPVRVKILAFPEHEHYAREMVRISVDSIRRYGQWFGAYPYPEFTIAESFFGWNGNECSTLVMIDSRVFAAPHLANSYLEYLVSHEVCHQWWYNLVGTNGYCETWMDEALATHFAHKLMTECHGKNNQLLKFPRGLEWLPNINRQDYRNYGLLGTIGRGEHTACVQEMPKFKHLVNLFSMCYDKGSRVVDMIEEKMGEVAFADFIRVVHTRYRYRILRVADFQRELEAYTGQSWKEFFDRWLFGDGLCDWAVEKVHCEKVEGGGCHATIILQQKADYNEPTTLGISLEKEDCYPIRIPIDPQSPRMEYPAQGAVVEALSCNRVKIEVVLPCKPTQVAVDPDQIIVDKSPGNNYWKKPIKFRLTPLYTVLDETDITTAYDRANIICGPYFNRPAYNDPWYSGATLFGVKAGIYKTQCFNGGVYAGYRSDYRDLIVGAEGEINHCFTSRLHLGFNVEQRLATFQDGRDTAFRGVLYGRYVLHNTSSLYLPPMEYVEAFGAYQDNFLPFNRNPAPGSSRYNDLSTTGVHYHKDLLTPYWDPIAGLRFDLTYAGGSVDVIGRGDKAAHQILTELTVVKGFPDLAQHVGDKLAPLFGYLSDSKFAVRGYFSGGIPDEVDYFTLGSGTLFRGYDQKQRQGSTVMLGNFEWRLPIVQHLDYDVCDHVFGVRNINAAMFYDVGDARSNGRSVGGVAHALGAGLRMDIAVFSFVERTTLRLDMAKTINDSTPMQFWFGVMHPF